MSKSSVRRARPQSSTTENHPTLTESPSESPEFRNYLATHWPAELADVDPWTTCEHYEANGMDDCMNGGSEDPCRVCAAVAKLYEEFYGLPMSWSVRSAAARSVSLAIANSPDIFTVKGGLVYLK